MQESNLELKADLDRRIEGDRLPPPLPDYVYEYYEIAYSVPAGQVARVPISATIEPIINVSLSSPVRILVGKGFRLPLMALAGPQPEAYSMEASGNVHGFYIRFTAVGPLVLLGIDHYGLTDGNALPLHEMVAPAFRETTRKWANALKAARSFEERASLTTAHLQTCYSPPDRRAHILSEATSMIEASGGNVRIADVSRNLGVSASTLRRYFEILGMSPKRYASIVRFRRAHAYLQTKPKAAWIDAVERFGYADQAHFVREYHRFSGTSPTGWKPEQRPVDIRMGIDNERP